MKKIILNEDEKEELLRLYNEELLGSHTIAKIMGYSKPIILRNLKELGVDLGSSGRRYIGGKSAADKRYREKNKVKIKEYHTRWSRENREYLREYHSTWRDINRVHVNNYSRNYEKIKCSIDSKYKLNKLTRTAVYTSLKERNINKNNNTFKLLGYSVEDLMSHLESKFIKGMGWDNYGEWHVDHIRPIASFNFESVDCAEFKECWSLDNLQPLWAFDNLSKGTKIIK